METVSWSSANIAAMDFRILFVRATLSGSECHRGNGILRPELSNLQNAPQKSRSAVHTTRRQSDAHPFWLPGAPCRSTMTLRPWSRAQPTALRRYGSCPETNGSPSATSNAQYPTGIRTWFRLPAPPAQRGEARRSGGMVNRRS